MTGPQDHDDLDALTDHERDALSVFDDLVDATCAPETEEEPMSINRFTFTRLVTAAGILAAFISLVAVFWQGREDDPALEVSPLAFLHQEENTPKLTFMIGLGDTGASQELKLQRWVGGGARHLEIFSNYEAFDFDQKKADAQRQEAIEKEKDKKDGYRPGQTYRLKDEKGKPLPVTWQPWAPGVTARKRSVPLKDAAEALKNAREGKPFSADLVQGGWLYSPPDWYNPLEPKGFTEADVASPKASVDHRGGRAVTFSIKAERADDFEKFTAQFTGQALCVVVEDVIWINPTVREPMRSAVMITGGADGFTEAEQKFILRALGEKK